MESITTNYEDNLSQKLGHNASVQYITKVLINGAPFIIAIIESANSEVDVPSLFVFESIDRNQIDQDYFCFNNLTLGPLFSNFRYWVVSTIYPLWCDITIRLVCGQIELLDKVNSILKFDTEIVRESWSVMVQLTSTLNKSIAHGLNHQENSSKWLYPFVFLGNPNFRRLSHAINIPIQSNDFLRYSFADSPLDKPSTPDNLLSTSTIRQSLIHKESVIHVFSRKCQNDDECATSPSFSNSHNCNTYQDENQIKQAMIQQIKLYLFTADLDTVRPIDVHNYIQHQFICYKENKSKYRSFVDENILICYGQMDEASQIIPYLYLGSEYNAADLDRLKAIHLHTVINVSTEIPAFFENDFDYYHIYVDDLPEVNISQYFDQAYEWIDSCINNKQTVLVHCQLGVSRSASIVIAYLIKKNKWTYEEAFSFVKKRRNQVRPNSGFVKQLHDYYNQVCEDK